MCKFSCTFVLSIVIAFIAILVGWNQVFPDKSVKTYSIDRKYFGSNSNDEENTEIKRFQIPYDSDVVADVINRLRKTRFYETHILVNQRDVNHSTYGFPRQAAETIHQYWINHFDWKKTVEELNQFEHYQTLIDGLNIHFVRIQSTLSNQSSKQAILFLHGWPSSFLEFLDVAQLFKTSSTVNYDLIIPSLPGFGYSQAPTRPGLTPSHIAVLMNSLMKRLGYESYVICGTDWGSFIGTYMSQLYPNKVKGFLTTLIEPGMSLKNSLLAALAHWVHPSFLLDSDEEEFLKEPFDLFKSFKFFWNEGGYFHIQSTKPDTIGYALNDSPLGLASYILEKWSRWSNNQTRLDQSPQGGLDRFTLDQLISTVMLYWTTGTITSSMRIYFEEMTATFSGENLPSFDGPVSPSVPIAIINYRNEIAYTPRTIAREKYPNIRLWIYHDQGGHFAALEKTQEYVRDLQNFLLLI